MPFREKAKALFKTRSRGESLTKTSSKSSRESHDVYKPGETMPRPKYRTPPTKEHKEKLEAFSFADSFRRTSFQSQHSPMGTRAPSRRASLFSLTRRKSQSSNYNRSRQVSRSNSVTSQDMNRNVLRSRDGTLHPPPAHGVARPTHLSTEIEVEGDDDVGNVGGPRTHHADHGISKSKQYDERHEHALHSVRPYTNGIPAYMSTAPDHHPFSEQDLALALHRSHLTVPAL